MVAAPAEPRLLSRVAPALLLVVLAPIIAEFLLADFTIRNLPLLLALMPLYGCGALLIREVARRAGRGWPTIVLLALAYALLEEAFLTQSLFNPNYVNQRLLDYGFIPALGTSLNWTFFVLSIHVVWSVGTPILIAEGVAAERRTVPWLKRFGLAVTIVFFLLGCLSTAAFSLKSSPFVASAMQFAVSGALIALTIVLAFIAFDRREAPPAPPTSLPAPRLPVVSLVTLLLASAYLASEGAARARDLPPAVPVVFRLACEATAIALFAVWSGRRGWNALHYLAIAAGTTLTYFLFGLNVVMSGRTHLGAPTNAADVVGHIGLGVGVLALIAWAAKRNVLAAQLQTV
jgi:hypothetical protein